MVVLHQICHVNSLVFVFSCSRWFVGASMLGAVMVSSRDGMFPGKMQHASDLETDEGLYFSSESEIHVAVVGMDEKSSGHADEEHLLVGGFMWMH